MLCLSRKVQQSIVIGDDITITVFKVSKKRVRLGIDAPKNISVHRQEIYEAIQEEKTEREQNPPKSKNSRVKRWYEKWL